MTEDGNDSCEKPVLLILFWFSVQKIKKKKKKVFLVTFVRPWASMLTTRGMFHHPVEPGLKRINFPTDSANVFQF